MTLDESYTYISICPTTGDQLSGHDVDYSDGICPRCGHKNNSELSTHEKKVVGRWNRPSFWERCRGKKLKFFRKDKEDVVMNALKGKHLE